MAKVDDLLQRWTKQIVLTIVARMAHAYSPTANLAVKGITKPPNPESKNARKPGPTHGFLAKSNPCSRQITSTDQSLRNSSRATTEQNDRHWVEILENLLLLPTARLGPVSQRVRRHQIRVLT